MQAGGRTGGFPVVGRSGAGQPVVGRGARYAHSAASPIRRAGVGLRHAVAHAGSATSVAGLDVHAGRFGGFDLLAAEVASGLQTGSSARADALLAAQKQALVDAAVASSHQQVSGRIRCAPGRKSTGQPERPNAVGAPVPRVGGVGARRDSFGHRPLGSSMSFAAGFRTELVKLAAPRWLREWKAKSDAGQKIQWRTVNGTMTSTALRREFGYSPRSSALTRASERGRKMAPTSSDTWAYYGGRRDPYLGFSRAMEAATKLRFSGAHALRSGEVGIPASMGGEFVVNPAAGASPFIYRGNSPRATGSLRLGGVSVTHGSRHPDVAANYALGRVSGLSQKPNQVVSAYPSHPFIEGPADTVAPRLGAVVNWQRPAWAPNNRPHAFGASVATYEAGVPHAQLPRAVGRYSVRPAQQHGRPVFAMSRLSGLPAENAFAPWVGGKS